MSTDVECVSLSSVFVFSVSLHNLCRANNRHRELVASHHTDKQKGRNMRGVRFFFYMEKLVEISFGDLKTIENRRTVFFVFFFKDDL